MVVNWSRPHQPYRDRAESLTVWVCDGRRATGLSFPNAFIPWWHVRVPHPESGAILSVSF